MASSSSSSSLSAGEKAERPRSPASSALRRAGVDLSAQTGPLAELPAGVSGYVGWANRLIFASSYLWVVLAALAVIRR